MDFKCDELILGKKDADSRALTLWPKKTEQCLSLNAKDMKFNFRVGSFLYLH